jgi:hypothetical protein
MREPTACDIAPLIGGERSYTALPVRYGWAGRGVQRTNQRAGTTYIPEPRRSDAHPSPTLSEWIARMRRTLPPAVEES